jgi:2-(3-amino-3-carboxypropyl)histidine synthase
MDRMFIAAKYKGIVKVPAKHLKSLPDKTCVTAAVQFIDSIPSVVKELEKLGKHPLTTQGRHSSLPNQILGCDVVNVPEAQAFLYLGDGLFHPKEIQLQNKKPVYCYNPKTKEYYEFGPDEVEKMQKRAKVNQIKFLSSDSIGVIISRKPGQYRLQQAMMLPEKYPDKSFYWFLVDTTDFRELENYPFIQCYVNTACPRMGRDDLNKISKPLINLEDIEGMPRF